jgi:hypothetical protein
LVYPPETGVVAGVLVFSARVAQANKEFDHGMRLSVAKKPAEAGFLQKKKEITSCLCLWQVQQQVQQLRERLLRPQTRR